MIVGWYNCSCVEDLECVPGVQETVPFSENKIQQVENHAVQIKSHRSLILLIFNPLIAAVPYTFLLGTI